MSNFTLFNVFMHSRRDHSAACQQEALVFSQVILTVPYYTIILNQRVTSFAIVKIFKTVEASYFDLI